MVSIWWWDCLNKENRSAFVQFLYINTGETSSQALSTEVQYLGAFILQYS